MSVPQPERFTLDAAARGIKAEVVSRGPAGSLEEAAKLLGLDPGDIVKSLVIRHKDGSYFFALVPGDRQISWPKLRAVVGVNRLSLPSAEQALEATGYERGTITPLGSSTAWPVYADSSMTGKRIALGAGAHGYTALVDADELVAGLGALLADISDLP